MSEKAKVEKAKHSVPRIGSLMFVLLWIGGHVGTWVLGILAAITLTRMVYFPTLYLPVMLGALGTGILSAMWQMLLVERGLRKSMRGWIPVSTAGWFLSGIAMSLMFYLLQTSNGAEPPEVFQRLFLIPLFLPAAVVQWAWLRTRVNHAWLWMVSMLAGAVMFMLPLMSPMNASDLPRALQELLPYLIIGLSALLYSGATGATMRYLWSQQRDKTKNEAIQAGQAVEDESVRLERLQEAEEDAHEQPSARKQEALKANR